MTATDAPERPPSGLRARLMRLYERGPGGPFDRRTWRSPLRGPWLTSVFAAVLLVGLPIMILTGLLSYAAYDPQFGGSNEQTPGRGLLGFYLGWDWFTNPSWLYRLNQGTHVTLGLVLIPIVFAKLWSVGPKLFAWPPVKSPAEALWRLAILLLVGSILFLLVTGTMNIQYDYAFGFSFYTGHLYAAWVFIAAFTAHVVLLLPAMRRALRSRSLRAELRTSTAETVPEPPDEYDLVAPDPEPATVSRRGLLAGVGGAALLVFGLSVGQTAGPRQLALLSPRGRSYGDGPNDFQVNRIFEVTGIDPTQTQSSYRLTVTGPSGRKVRLTREELLAMPQATEELPIACVEGWSTVETWTGVRLRDLAAMVDALEADSVFVESLETTGAFRTMTLSDSQFRDAQSLLALKVNGADLSLDHGFPARNIVPAAPGVRNTKWVSALTFQREP
jgi:DMSO/TMAO reductase YedYZ molybdopterin-dependent catalytic subunit